MKVNSKEPRVKTPKKETMKYILPLVAALVLFSCKTVEIVEYQYRSSTMLGTRTITVTQDSVVTNYNGRSESTHTARATSAEEWLELKASVKNVKLNDIRTLEAPSNKRSTDASPYGSVMLSTKDSTYQSASFDGYVSHSMLLPLMDAIKKISNKN